LLQASGKRQRKYVTDLSDLSRRKRSRNELVLQTRTKAQS